MENNNASQKESADEKVIFFPRGNADGLTITELVGLYKLSRSTIRIALARLEERGNVVCKNIGIAKVYVMGGRR